MGGLPFVENRVGFSLKKCSAAPIRIYTEQVSYLFFRKFSGVE